jgi:uncharacterized protein
MTDQATHPDMTPLLRVSAACLLLTLASPLPLTAMPNCSQARSNVEKLLCTSTELVQLDDAMAKAFREAFVRTDDKGSLLESQRDWINQERDACNDVPCLREAYRNRMEALERR